MDVLFLQRVGQLTVLFTLFGCIGLAQNKPAELVTMVFPPENTTIQWTLTDVLHTVHGTFKLEGGTVRFNPKSGAAEGIVTVDARSGASGNAVRDGRMNREFLESARYPAISFLPNHVSGEFDLKSDHTVSVDGILRLHGADHPLRLEVRVHPQTNAVTAATRFVVPYVAWGIKDPSTFFLRVSKTVEISVEATAKVTP